MKRIFVLLAGTAVISLASAGLATAGGQTAKLGLHPSSLGKLVVNRSGFTVYEFGRDRRNTDTCMKIKGCATTWQPVTTRVRPIAGRGINASLVGTIPIPGGARQVTYAGHPLYTYTGDSSRAQTDYVSQQQFGGTWLALNAAGKKVG